MEGFFSPFKGTNYLHGFGGKSVLILGASFYCNRKDCEFFNQCTSTQVKDSSPYDERCPVYVPHGKALSQEPSYVIEDAPRTYQNFAKVMAPFVGEKDYDKVWEHFAFTNYVQFFLPATNGARNTRPSDLSERDFEAFVATLKDLKPNIVIVWGRVINEPLLNNKFVIRSDEYEETKGYVWRLRIPDIDHDIVVINPYHPSSSAWYDDVENLKNNINNILKETNMRLSEQECKELVYNGVIKKAVSLYENEKKMKAEELLSWINENYGHLFKHPYVSVRNVIKAAWRRANSAEKEALEFVFLNCKGEPLLK
jgi:hypothetical protein